MDHKRSVIPAPEIERVEGVCGGEPVITGTRITVNHIYSCFTELLWDVNRILKAYPHLTKAQIMEAIKYARRNPWCLKPEKNDESQKG